MRVGETGVRFPHDLVQFQELAKEAWYIIVDFGCIRWICVTHGNENKQSM